MAADWSIMGTYVLALYLEDARTITVGRLGTIDFRAGWYLYAGSARGPGGLKARVARHWRRLAEGKRAHWHVDFLREEACWGGAWGSATDQRMECTWAAALRALPGASVVAPGFGASDCRCRGHLVHVPELPDEGWFAGALGALAIPTAIMDR